MPLPMISFLLISMEFLSSAISTNIWPYYFAGSLVSKKQKATCKIQLLHSSYALASAVTDYISQILMRDAKKLLELEVLMQHLFLSMNKQEMMIKKYWSESQK